jgi:hypothetical protein
MRFNLIADAQQGKFSHFFALDMAGGGGGVEGSLEFSYFTHTKYIEGYVMRDKVYSLHLSDG